MDESDALSMTLTGDENGTMTVTMEDSIEATCTLRGKEWDCAPVVSSETYDDTVVTTTIQMDGTFSDEDTFAGSMEQRYHCEGADCADLLLAEDCSFSLGFTAISATPEGAAP